MVYPRCSHLGMVLFSGGAWDISERADPLISSAHWTSLIVASLGIPLLSVEFWGSGSCLLNSLLELPCSGSRSSVLLFVPVSVLVQSDWVIIVTVLATSSGGPVQDFLQVVWFRCVIQPVRFTSSTCSPHFLYPFISLPQPILIISHPELIVDTLTKW